MGFTNSTFVIASGLAEEGEAAGLGARVVLDEMGDAAGPGLAPVSTGPRYSTVNPSAYCSIPVCSSVVQSHWGFVEDDVARHTNALGHRVEHPVSHGAWFVPDEDPLPAAGVQLLAMQGGHLDVRHAPESA